MWWAEQGSNLRPRPCKGRALPAELSARTCEITRLSDARQTESVRLCPKLCPAKAAGLCPANFRDASCRSPGLTMWYRSNTLRVLCPVIFIATRSGTPALTRFRTAVLRKSCRYAPGTPAALHASTLAFRKSRNRLPANLGPRCGKSHRTISSLLFSRSLIRSSWSTGESAARASDTPIFPLHSSPCRESSRNVPASRSRCRRSSVSTSLCIRHPNVYAIVTAT
jgi:hypothetical protein